MFESTMNIAAHTNTILMSTGEEMTVKLDLWYIVNCKMSSTLAWIEVGEEVA